MDYVSRITDFVTILYKYEVRHITEIWSITILNRLKYINYLDSLNLSTCF